MHFDVLIVSEETKNLNTLKNKYNNINFSFKNNFENIKYKYLDLLIINKNIKEKEKLIKASRRIGFELCFIESDSSFEKIDDKIKSFQKNYYLNRKLNINSSHIFDELLYPIIAFKNNDLVFTNKYLLDSLNEESIKNLKNIKINNFFATHNKKLKLKDKNNKDVFFGYQNFYDDNGFKIIFLNNLTSEIEYEKRLESLLFTDSLTNLPNRKLLIDELQNNIIDIQAISILDINSFKEINDFYGHRVGDLVLKEVSDTIQKLIQNNDTLKLYKFSADTYCIIDQSNDNKAFEKKIKSIVDYLYKRVFIINKHSIDLRVCAGISFSNKKNKLITADIALQAAKKKYKDYLVFYEELDNLQEYEKNMFWTKQLKKALKNDRIVVFYQAIINNKNMKIEKFECLVRLIDEDGKIISPFFFLDVSKKSNNYKDITRIVIEKSFKMFSKLNYEFSINISYEDIEDPTFLPFVKEKLKKYKVNKKVVFEILEDENVKNYDLLINFIEEIKKQQCKVAIDDFGSGYSNFEHLLKMDVDYLKIDASLIKNIAKDESSYKITKTIVEFAKSLKLKTIAEFVENEEILDIVKKLNINYSQGYHFCAPISDPIKLIETKETYE